MTGDETPSGEFNVRFEKAMDEHERVRWNSAAEQVDAFIKIVQNRYGIQEKEIPVLLDGLRWAAEHKRNLEKMGTTAMLTLLGMVLTGMGLAIWEGLKTLLRRDG